MNPQVDSTFEYKKDARDRHLEELLDKVCCCERKDGSTFSARLIDIEGYMLFFANRRGAILQTDLRDLVYIAPHTGMYGVGGR